MYVYSDRPRPADLDRDDIDNSIYWCVKTMKGYGPDDEPVSAPDCRLPGRSCYEPF